ncbi:MAG TPA: hypothetical protein VK899_00280, partial [Gemmatimonadales bacterium]|nr:hypothetical protein [Gemmatimonadales bacterium]
MKPLQALSRRLVPVTVTALLLGISPGAGAQYLTVTTFAGQSGGAVDGPGVTALFHSPTDVAVHGGNLYVADSQNATIRQISPAGVVTTLAGLAREAGSTDATGSEARFNSPGYLATDAAGNIYVADSGTYTVRKITPAGSVTTLAGLAGAFGSVDGTGPAARFQQFSGITTDRHGHVFVSEFSHVIRKITPAGVVTTVAGLADAPGSDDGNGSAARFNYPGGVAADSDGNLSVADAVNQTIRKITPAGPVTTFAGQTGISGSDDGNGQDARFYYPGGLTIDDGDNLYVTDSGYAVRKITPDGEVTTLAGQASMSGYVDA